MRSRTRAGLAGALVIGGLVLAGCGGDDSGNAGGDGGDGGAPADIVVHGNDSLKFDKESYSATAGENVIELVNDGSQAHTLLFDEDSVDFKKLGVTGQGDTDSGTADLPAGTYTIYCDIAGHRAAGMEAKIVVN
jgi:plastocyanin